MLTIELVEVVHNTLHYRTAAVGMDEKTLLLSLALVELEGNTKRDEDDRLNDAESTDSPSPAAIVEE